MTPPPATGDLSRAVDERGEVTGVEELGGGIVELTVRLPVIAARARAGEFAQLRCGDGGQPLLRRPMSVARTEGGRCTFVFERVGEGTRRLAALAPGAPIDVLGPLGRGFTLLPGAGHVVIVAGGLGCAPFPLTVAQALDAGAGRVTLLNGAATAARLYPAERFTGDRTRVRVLEATEDGSRGHRGRVTELVAGVLADGGDALYACGPNPMLAALAGVLTGVGRPRVCEVSLEAPMGCGYGTCLGCALPVRRAAAGAGQGRSGWALCCREGPAMPIDAVDWKALRALPPANVA